MGRMKSQKVSSTKNSKCGSANKHVKINRNLPEKKNPMMSSPLTDNYSKSYLAAMAFCIQKSARPILLTHEKYLAVSIRVLCRGLALPLASVCRTVSSGNIIAFVICSTC